MTRPDLDAIRARIGIAHREHPPCASEDVTTLLAYIDELESCTAHTTSWTIGETEWAQRIATLEHMLGEERENVDTLRARVAELEAEIAALEPRSVMLKRVDAALTEAGCVQPLAFDGTIESAIKDLARRATRAEQLFVDEYDARKAAEREIAELKARIAVLEAMR